MIVEAHATRRLFGLLSSAQEQLIELPDPIDAVATLERGLDEINGIFAAGGSGFRALAKIVEQSVSEAEARQVAIASGKCTGVTCGLSNIDKRTGGWQAGQMIVVAGRPGMGKTAVMLHFAKSAAMAGTAVCFYSLEMSDVGLTDRLLLSECDIEADNFRQGRMVAREWESITEAQAKLSALPVHINDKAAVTVQYIARNARYMHRQGKCGMVMVDYIQLAVGNEGRNKNRENIVREISASLKVLAKELSIPVVALAQLNRSVEDTRDKRPMLSDLRESGAIEQDADVVLLLCRPKYYGIDSIRMPNGDISSEGILEINIAKQRDGATGKTLVRHNETLTHFEDWMPYNTVQSSDIEDKNLPF
jgi:replicative DNA helicase